MSGVRPSDGLDAARRATLLRLARAAIAEDLGQTGTLDEAFRGADLGGPLAEPRATFVTLRSRRSAGSEDLRGCIGVLKAHEPLHASVVRNARRAAFHDPRFPPLEPAELPSIRISVSVLSPAVDIAGPEEIVVGRDGVRLEAGPYRAVFLPEVASDHGWDRDELIRQLLRKAGAPALDRAHMRLATFRTESFSE